MRLPRVRVVSGIEGHSATVLSDGTDPSGTCLTDPVVDQIGAVYDNSTFVIWTGAHTQVSHPTRAGSAVITTQRGESRRL